MADKTVAVLTFTNGVLAEPESGGPVDVAFLHRGDSRMLSDILADALAQCNRDKTYAHITMTLVLKTGAVVVTGPADAEHVAAEMRKAGLPA